MLTLTLILLLHVDPARAAEIEFEQREAQREVDEKYGNKKPSELTPDETKAKIKDRADADTKVLEKFGTTPREWARESMKQNRTELAKTQAGVRALDAQAQDAKKEKPKEAPREMQVQRGFSEETPVTLDEKQVAGQVGVEKSLPPDVAEELQMAKDIDGVLGKDAKPGKAAPAAKAAPAKAAKKSKKKKNSD